MSKKKKESGTVTVCQRFYISLNESESGISKEAFKKEILKIQNQLRCAKNKYVSSRYGLILEGIDTGDKGNRKILYDKFHDDVTSLYSGNVDATLHKLNNTLFTAKSEINWQNGLESVASFKENQPIDIHKQSIMLYKNNNIRKARVSMFSNTRKKELDMKVGRVVFDVKINNQDNRSAMIFDRCLSGEYKYGGGNLQYTKKGDLVFTLSYSFLQQLYGTEPGRICGVDIGIRNPVYVAINDSEDRLHVEGDEILAFNKKVTASRAAMSRGRVYAGSGSVGHGYKKRMESAQKYEDKIARFRNTKNDQYSRAVVDFALKNGCETIQMEDLTGISKDDKFLKNWSYYDLQKKIEYKAKQEGIKVVKVDPKYTSQRCHKCGYINSKNRNGESFICLSCNEKCDADYNAAKNISVDGIAEIIKSAKPEGTKKAG